MRVLAVTTNASLVVALGSMMREWEVVTVRDIERATAEGPGSSVALIDLGETDAGVELAGQLYHNGVTIPCVVIGDKPVDAERATVLVRPFSLEELGNAVRQAAAAPTRQRRAEPDGNGAASIAPAVPAPAPVAVEPEPEPFVEPARFEPETPPEPERSRFGLTKIRVPEPEPYVEPAPSIESEQAPVEAAVEPAYDLEPTYEPEPAYEPEPEPELAYEQPAGDVREVFHEPIAPQRAQEPSSRWKLGRRGKRPAAATTEAETPLVRRLKIAAAHARELEGLIEQMPFLADLRAMADGLIGEIDRQFVCAVASVTVRRDEGFDVVAHRGLSRVEASMVIPETQSLFSDVLKTREGVLIQPVDLAQGLVAGIGGARTEALMVAPALVGDECVAVVVVGGDQFNEQDLDRLSDLAAEAAPGLAVAQLLDRLRVRPEY